ncbi:MAG: FAD-dependent oxidoreductase, partial [Rhodanobacteraceae bacterium]
MIVIGAGIAGLAAAQTLSRAGSKVVVLEARDRVGGRIFTDRSFGASVELGAASSEMQRRNPLTTLARQWQIAVRPIDYASLAAYDFTGSRIDDEAADAADRLEEAVTKS